MGPSVRVGGAGVGVWALWSGAVPDGVAGAGIPCLGAGWGAGVEAGGWAGGLEALFEQPRSSVAARSTARVRFKRVHLAQ